MTRKQEVTDILVAIGSVKRRAVKARMVGNIDEYTKLFGDLVALKICLEGSATALIDELDAGDAILITSEDDKVAA